MAIKIGATVITRDPSGSGGTAYRSAPLGAAVWNPPVRSSDALNLAAAEQSLSLQLSRLNKYLSDSGQPNQFRLGTSSGKHVIQEISAATETVLAEYPVADFPALARSYAAAGMLFDGSA